MGKRLQLRDRNIVSIVVLLTDERVDVKDVPSRQKEKSAVQ